MDINSIEQLTTLKKGFKVDGLKYSAEWNERSVRFNLHSYTAEGKKMYVGFLMEDNANGVKVFKRAHGLLFSSPIQYWQIEPII